MTDPKEQYVIGRLALRSDEAICIWPHASEDNKKRIKNIVTNASHEQISFENALREKAPAQLSHLLTHTDEVLVLKGDNKAVDFGKMRSYLKAEKRLTGTNAIDVTPELLKDAVAAAMGKNHPPEHGHHVKRTSATPQRTGRD